MSDRCTGYEKWLPKLREHLVEECYSTRTSQRCVVIDRHFLDFLAKQHIEVDAATPAQVEHYLQRAERGYRKRHGHSDYRGWRSVQTSSVHMLSRLVHGQWPPLSVAGTSPEVLLEKICGEYARWMSNLRGLSPITVLSRRGEARRFLGWVIERARRKDLTHCGLAEVNAYVKEWAGSLRRRTLPSFATDIRSFLGWLHMTGQTACELSSAVITPSLHRFESIPSALRTEDVAKVLVVTEGDRTRKRIRDYAILMLLSRCGMRAGEITALRLQDIDWRQEVIRIHQSKTDYPSYLPLLPDVGESVLKYLQKARLKTPVREIFIRCHAPYRPFKSGSSLYGLIQWRLKAAGVVPAGKRGPHAFRHARAVSMLRATVPWEKRIKQEALQRHRRPYIFNEREIQCLLATAFSLPSPQSPLRPHTTYMMLVLAYCSGLRIGENVRLNVGDFDVCDGGIDIRSTKFFKSRRLPLSRSVVAALQSYLKARRQAGAPNSLDAALFWHLRRSGRYSYSTARQLLVRILRRAGLKPASGRTGARIHNLRHAFVRNVASRHP